MLTKYETFVLAAIAFHEYNSSNGARPECWRDVYTYCWADEFAAPEHTVQQCKGVLSSLVQKGLIFIGQYDDEYNSVNFTEAGYAEFAKFCPEGMDSAGFAEYYKTL